MYQKRVQINFILPYVYQVIIYHALVAVTPSSPLRTTTPTALYYPPSYDTINSPQPSSNSGIPSLHVSPQEEHPIIEPGITPMPTIASTREEESPPQPEKPIEKEETKKSFNSELMEGV